MSTTGQGDQISETNKDDEPEISTTKSKNDGLKGTIRQLNEKSEATATDPENVATVKLVASDLPSSSSDKESVTGTVIDSTAVVLQESMSLMKNEDSEKRVGAGCDVTNTEVSHQNSGVSEISLDPSSLVTVAKMTKTETDKDGIHEDDIKLRWDDSDDEDDDGTSLTQTDDVLKMLDEELGENILQKLDSFESASEEKPFNSVNDNKSDKSEKEDVIKVNSSFEKDQKIIAEIESLIQDDEILNTTQLSAKSDEQVTLADTDKQLKSDEMPKVDFDSEKPIIIKFKPETVSIKSPLELLTQESKGMDVDDSEDIAQEKEVTKEIETSNLSVTGIDSYEESQKTVPTLTKLTEDEIDKITELPSVTVDKIDKHLEDDEISRDELIDAKKPNVEETVSTLTKLTEDDMDKITEPPSVTVDKIDKHLEDDEISRDELIDAKKPNVEETVSTLTKLTEDEMDKITEPPSVTVDKIDKHLEDDEISRDELIDAKKPNVEETVSIKIPVKPLTKDDEEIVIDKSLKMEKEKEIEVASTAFASSEKSPLTISKCDQDDKIINTELLYECENTVTVDKVHKNIDNVLKNELDESEKQDIEESYQESKDIEVLSKPSSTENETVNLDDSNDIINEFTAEVTKTRNNTDDSDEKEKVDSVKDKEVLDNIDDKQDSANIVQDVIAEDLKPVETVTSECDISSTDKTSTLKEDSIIPLKDEQNKTKTTENISETSQPIDDKEKENDAIDTIQNLDKSSTVQKIDSKSNDGQENVDHASSEQSDKKLLDVTKPSESQAVDDNVSSTQEIDDKKLEAMNISANAEDTSIIDDSLIDITISPNKHHRINKPNVMLDIPTQDFSDIEAELSDSEMNDVSEKTEEISENVEKPTKILEKSLESNKFVNVVQEISGITAPTIQIDATTSKLNITTVSPLKLNQASSTDVKFDNKSSTETQDILIKNNDEKCSEKASQIDDDKLSSSRQIDDQQPSSSKDIGDDKVEKHTLDDADDVQESDSLGLLAESSRVLDDDDVDEDEEEAEEPGADDNDDDEDFDPYDESSSQMLEDLDTDESNPPAEEKTEETEVIDADEQTDKQAVQPDNITNILEKVLGNFTDLKQPPISSGKILNYVEVEESSDSDDVQEISKTEEKDLVSIKVPAEVDVMLSSGADGGTSAIHSNKDEVVISVPKPQQLKRAKINTSEVTIKSASKNLESIKIPETTTTPEKKKDEIFNIDSDDEEEKIEEKPKEYEKENSPEPTKSRKCINPHCTTTNGVYSKASRATLAYYSLTRRSGAACQECTEKAGERSQALVKGIKDLRPLLDLDMDAPAHQLVEISDSDEDEEPIDDSEKIGTEGAKFILDNLVDVFNEAWVKYELESRLKHTESCLITELELLEAGAKELDAMLDECQIKTDAIRTDFYKDYEPKRKHMGGIVIYDTPFSSYSHTEKDVELASETSSSRYPKRRSASTLFDPPSKKQALETLDKDRQVPIDQSKIEEDKDISVVKLSAESAPASLPPHGELVRPTLFAGMSIYAMKNAFGTWNKAKIMEIVQEATPTTFTQCRVKFEHKVKNSCKVLPARCLAYSEPCEVRYTIGTRVIALFKDPQSARLDAFYAGVVAEVPNPVNNYRYLVFFDDGYAQYIQHADTRLVCQASALVWEEVHPFIHDFVRNYLKCYPERPMVRLRRGETLNTEWNGKWWSSRVLQVDASIALIHFDQDDRTEWIYRGSTRLEPLYLELQAAKAGGRSRLRLPRTKQIRTNMPCVEYTRSDEQANAKAAAETQAQQRQAEELRRQRAVAKKSTTDRPTNQQQTVIQGTPFEGVISRVVYYTPKHAVKPPRMDPHVCNPSCGKRSDLLTLQDLRTYNPLAKPLLSGWERQTVRYKGHREVMYRAPCGRRLRNMLELHRYLSILQSDLSVDLFDFTPGTHCLAEFVLNKCIVGKKDLSHGKENVPVPCVNYYDDSLPEFCSYNTERTPTAGVPLNLDPDFLCGCDCTDDCQDKSKCACWKMTLEGARTIGLEGDNIGYVYRRLPEPLPSGIYECNSRCKCKQTCLNRVAQHPLQLKLQVFKTMNRGWGIRALNDVPKGSFLCVYAGNLLTDATANLDGLNEGDEYLAELDYIEVVEGMKEGYEDDVPEEDKALDKKDATHASESESELSSESEEEQEGSGKDCDFQPSAYIPQPQGGVYFQKSLRKREKAKKKEEKEKKQKENEAAKKREECITISDDEEVREPSRFTADDVADKDRKHSSRVSVRTLFGKDEACYIMDAKVQGNIGRYLNHSCHPNVFVQNVFVDTHDPRFPWVAFFALTHVRAGNELTWNYNYDVGSVPGKVLYCYCGAPNCRGRLL